MGGDPLLLSPLLPRTGTTATGGTPPTLGTAAPAQCAALPGMTGGRHAGRIIAVCRSVVFASSNAECAGLRYRISMERGELAWCDDETGECYHRGALRWDARTGKLSGGGWCTYPDPGGRAALEAAWVPSAADGRTAAAGGGAAGERALTALLTAAASAALSRRRSSGAAGSPSAVARSADEALPTPSARSYAALSPPRRRPSAVGINIGLARPRRRSSCGTSGSVAAELRGSGPAGAAAPAPLPTITPPSRDEGCVGPPHGVLSFRSLASGPRSWAPPLPVAAPAAAAVGPVPLLSNNGRRAFLANSIAGKDGLVEG